MLAFFSYSRQDSEFVLKLARDLRTAGAEVWLDQIDIDPGERWDSAVEKALANSSRMLVVLSPASVESTNVMDEVSFALEENKRVIPVLHRDCKIPFRLRRLQYIDARVEYDKGLAELVRMLRGHEHAEAAAAASPGSLADVRTSGPPADSGAVEQANRESAEAERRAQERLRAEETERENARQERIAREQAEAERLAKQKADQERIAQAEAERLAKQRADQERLAQQRAEAERQAARTAEEEQRDRKPAAPSSRKYIIIAAAVLVVVVGLVMALRNPNPNPPSPNTEKPGSSQVSPSSGESSAPAAVKPGPEAAGAPVTEPSIMPNSREWVERYLQANEGPSVGPLRQYFDDVVSPYFSIPSAGWDAIEADKLKYFERFPTIHYTLVGQPLVTRSPGDGAILEFDMQYSNVRKDGQTLEGTTHMTLNMRHVDGRWKIAGARERKVK